MTGKPEVELRQPAQWAERIVKIQAMRDWVTENLDNAFMRQSKHYNLRRRQVRFRKGEFVFAKGRMSSSKAQGVAAKFFQKFVGAYKIHKVLSLTVYVLSSLKGEPIGKSHVGDLKPYVVLESR